MSEHMTESEIELIRLQTVNNEKVDEFNKRAFEIQQRYAADAERRAIRMRCLEMARSSILFKEEIDYKALKAHVDELEAIVYQRRT